jgi:hypothetical protein
MPRNAAHSKFFALLQKRLAAAGKRLVAADFCGFCSDGRVPVRERNGSVHRKAMKLFRLVAR